MQHGKDIFPLTKSKKYKQNANRITQQLWNMTGIYCDHYKNRMKKDGIAMHDSLPIAWLTNPDIVTSKPYYVTVDINGRFTYGMTVTDCHNVMNKQPNAQVALDVDREKFINMIFASIERLVK